MELGSFLLCRNVNIIKMEPPWNFFLNNSIVNQKQPTDLSRAKL